MREDRTHARLSFTVRVNNLAEAERAGTKIADQFYGYKEQLDNPAYKEWENSDDTSEDAPPRYIKNEEDRPYRLIYVAQVDATGVAEEYNYNPKFLVECRALPYFPTDEEPF